MRDEALPDFLNTANADYCSGCCLRTSTHHCIHTPVTGNDAAAQMKRQWSLLDPKQDTDLHNNNSTSLSLYICMCAYIYI